MEDTLKDGDIVLVNRMAYGAKLPKDLYEIPLLNLLTIFNNNYLNGLNWGYYRLPGFSYIQSNDIIIFESPFIIGEGKLLVKRVVGLPSDTIQIVNNEVIINHKKTENPPNVTFDYEIINRDVRDIMNYLPELNVKDVNHMNMIKPFAHVLRFNEEQRLKINQNMGDSTIEKLYHPASKLCEYSPLVIPQKGKRIYFKNHLDVYLKVLTYEGVDAYIISERIMRDGKELASYIFANDYFFVIGDNRHGSNDSREWGLISEQNVVGKIWCVLISN